MAIYPQIDALVKLSRGPWHVPINEREVILNPASCFVPLSRKKALVTDTIGALGAQENFFVFIVLGYGLCSADLFLISSIQHMSTFQN